jgi:hypothetical protein
MGVDDVDVAELETCECGFGAFDEVLAAEAQVVDFVAGSRQSGGVGAPVDLSWLVRATHG